MLLDAIPKVIFLDNKNLNVDSFYRPLPEKIVSQIIEFLFT